MAIKNFSQDQIQFLNNEHDPIPKRKPLFLVALISLSRTMSQHYLLCYPIVEMRIWEIKTVENVLSVTYNLLDIDGMGLWDAIN